MTLPMNKKLSMSLDDIQFVESQYKSKEEQELIELTNENESLKTTIQNLVRKNENLETEKEGINKTLASTLKNLRNVIKQKQTISTELWELQNKYNENVEIINLYSWIIHINDYSQEFISGYRHKSSNEYVTSHILHKIPMSTCLLVITENETIYCLPYCESSK